MSKTVLLSERWAPVKVMLFGSRGYIGRKIKASTKDAIICPEADICDRGNIEKLFRTHRPDVVINSAGKSGVPNVDWCESNKISTFHSNVVGALSLADLCVNHGVLLVQLSTGCIYSGDNGGAGFTEADAPNFHGSYYVRTKLWTENLMREMPVLILRLRMPFDGSDHPRNLIMKLSHYSNIVDADNSLTNIDEFIKVLWQLVERKKTGIYNVVNSGSISPYQIMVLYKQIVKPDHEFGCIDVAGLKNFVEAPRSMCILSNEKLVREGIGDMRPVRESLEEALKQVHLELQRSAA